MKVKLQPTFVFFFVVLGRKGSSGKEGSPTLKTRALENPKRCGIRNKEKLNKQAL